MTKEQEAAIKYLEDMKNNLKDLNKSGYVYAKENIDTVLNMLKEISAESAEKDKIIAEKSAEIEKLKTDFKIVDQECSRLERKEAKQDKMIDLIINTVYKRFKTELVLEYGFENEEQFKQCFERRAEDERDKI